MSELIESPRCKVDVLTAQRYDVDANDDDSNGDDEGDSDGDD